MKFTKQSVTHARAYALLIVMAFTGVSLLVLTGAMTWSSQTASITQRNNEYFVTLAAAEGATERLLSRISDDYRSGGEALVYSRMAAYSDDIPTAADSAKWNAYEFSNGQGTLNSTFVNRLAPSSFVNLDPPYKGLRGMAATYRVVSNAKNFTTRNNLVGAVGQDVQVVSIPLFQFAIFYTLDLEINPGPPMTITGPVHANANIYTQPQNALAFKGGVSSAGSIIPNKKSGDPLNRTPGTVAYTEKPLDGVSSLNLPIGTNNSSDAIHAVLESPPFGESANSQMGKERYYNKADVVILVTNVTTQSVVTKVQGGKTTYTTNYSTTTKVLGSSGAVNGFSTSIPAAQLGVFVSTTSSFYDKREAATIRPIDIDVAALKGWSATNSVIRPVLNRDINIIYVEDARPVTLGEEAAVRIKNGQALPPLGLTIATPEPLYVQGNYNAPASALGTTNTTQTKPASLVGDSITVLSTAWNDANGGAGIGSRTAANTTVNAAFLGGIVETRSGSYSGGVENFPRFLENWGGKTFTYNGSMVVMFDSRIARRPWGSSDVYSPPARNWAFDTSFLDPTKLPPGTPQLLTLNRVRWGAIAPGTTSF